MQLAFEFRESGTGETRIEPTPDDLECWRPVEGWPGYEVSDWGRVQSYWGKGGIGQGRRGIGLTPKIMAGWVTREDGRKTILLYRNGGTEKRYARVYVLVIEAFIGPRPPGMEACHNDGNPANNRLYNLRWDTMRGNALDSVRHGTHNLPKLTEAMIPEIWCRLVLREPCARIAKDYKVSSTTIQEIKYGDSWSHITQYLPGWPLPVPSRKIDVPPVFVNPELAREDLELWLGVPDWPGYEVSNRGRVKSCRWSLYQAQRNGKKRDLEWQEVHPTLMGRYLGLSLCEGMKRKTTIFLHRLILSVFAGLKPHPAMIACHNDGDKFNNYAYNLRWDSPRSNAIDREKHRKNVSI